MPAGPTTELALLKAFEGALREGLLLDEILGGVLDAALNYFDAAAVALLPAGGAPPVTRSGRSMVAVAAELRLAQHLGDVLMQRRAQKVAESGLTFLGAPIKDKDQLHGAFGVALGQSASISEAEEAIRLFARAISHVLDRDRTVGTLMRRREEAVALFELAAGALHSLNADEVIRLTVASLSRELEFDRVVALSFDPETREVEEILSHGGPPSSEPRPAASVRRPIDQEEILVRCLSAHGPAFDDEDTGGVGPTRRRRLALPIQAGETVFGFLIMSRRGAFVLTPQEMRLAQELAKLAAGALEKARLMGAERRTAERVAFVSRLHAALSGLTDVQTILSRTAEEVGPHFDLDLCTVRILPAGELAGAAAAYVKGGSGIAPGEEIPDHLLSHLSAEGSHVLLADVASDPLGLSLVPAPGFVKNLPRPLSLLAVPIAYRGSVVGVLAGVAGGRPRGIGEGVLHSFEALAVEMSLAVTSARLLQKERDSYRFLDRLREVGRSLSTTFDVPRIKQMLCEQSVTLLKADAAQFWDADSQTKALQISARWGAEVGGELGRTISAERGGHPVLRAFNEKTVMLAEENQIGDFFAGGKPATGPPPVRAAVVPLLFQDEVVGILSLCGRKGSEPWAPDLVGRLALLADAGAVALHNARMMKIIEQQTERDGQTGLYNRASILRRLESEIRRAERSGQSLAVAHLRLEGLSEAIQRLGPSFGDALLPKAAAQLVRATRAVNIVGRDRFDRFWILIFEATKAQGQKAVSAIQKNFDANAVDPRLESANLKLNLTVGIAAYPEDAFDTPSLILRAEEALDDAVRGGPGSVVLYGALADTDGPTM